MKIQCNLAFSQTENHTGKTPDLCQCLCHDPASFYVRAREVPRQVADFWVCSKAAEVNVFSFTGSIWLCVDRLISRVFETKSRPWSIPHHNLVFHLVLCPLMQWWWGGRRVSEAQVQLFPWLFISRVLDGTGQNCVLLNLK